MIISFYYQAYGLRIKSQKKLPYFISSVNDLTDVEIYWDNILLDASGFEKEKFEKAEGGIRWILPEIAVYTVLAGKMIRVQSLSEDEDLVNSRIYGHVMAMILIQRGTFPFHSASVITPSRKIWVIFGNHGTGKTHLVLQLKEMGFPIFSDDILRIDWKDGKAMGNAAYPVISLRESSFGSFKKYSRKNTRKSKFDYERYHLDFAECFVTETLEIAGMIFLYPSETPRLEKMSPKEVLKSLFMRAIMGKYIPILGQEAKYFHLISKLAQTVTGYNWGNTKHLNTVDLKNLESLFK